MENTFDGEDAYASKTAQQKIEVGNTQIITNYGLRSSSLPMGMKKDPKAKDMNSANEAYKLNQNNIVTYVDITASPVHQQNLPLPITINKLLTSQGQNVKPSILMTPKVPQGRKNKS